jgi:dienelactone hydrolase
MKACFLWGLLAALLAAGCRPTPTPRVEEPDTRNRVQLTAKDGVKVSAYLYQGPQKEKGPILLLFHQARSSAHEYDPIAQRLVKEGFSCLAVDQRSGGTLYGQNRTMKDNHLEEAPPYEDAYQDMVAALDWAVQKGYSPILAWGSSYSASLVFRLAAEHQEVAGVLAFSPGEYMSEKGIVAEWASRVRVPAFVASAPEEVDAASALFERLGSEKKRQYVPDKGVHGSSMLRPDKNPDGAEGVWGAVLSFLRPFQETKL